MRYGSIPTKLFVTAIFGAGLMVLPAGAQTLPLPPGPLLASGSVTITGTEPLTSPVRVNRNGVQSVLGKQKPFPGLLPCPGGTCYFQTVAVDTQGQPYIQVTLVGSANVFAVAYLDSFTTANLATNYLGDSGFSDGSSFQVTVPAGHKLILAFNSIGNNFGTLNYFVNAILPSETTGVYQLRYLANLDKGDSYVNLTNAGTLDGRAPAGNICVNVYTFDPAEELISCCACPITPNGLVSLSARNDLISNTLTPGVPTSITVKLVSSAVFDPNGVNISATSCNASAVGTGLIGVPNTGNVITRGMRAWATTLHLNTSGSPAVGYQKTETPFSAVELSASELTKLQSFCGFIQANGSGFGICKACRFGALGGEQK